MRLSPTVTMIFTLMFALLSKHAVQSQKIVDEYPTLPTMWKAQTIEPGAPGNGKGLESYSFNPVPTEDHPSALWSNYTGCQRLIYVPNNYDAKRYLLGCEAVDCCYETQSGNQVEFQIPNVQYSDPNKKVDVYYQRANITNFGETIEADEWSWSFVVGKLPVGSYRAYTVACDDCVNGVQLLQWQASAMGSEFYPIQFKNYKGYDETTTDGKNFQQQFQIPDVCAKSNLLACDTGVHDKYFGSGMPKIPEIAESKSHFSYGKSVKGPSCGTCGTTYQGCCAGFALDGYPCDCHLQEGGSGKSGSECGDCGTAYAACCIGYAADGYPCECDVM